MAARDRFEFEITCKKCKSSGIVKASEEDHPWMRSPDFTVDDLPDGWSVEAHAEFRRDTKVKCRCGAIMAL